MKSLLLVLFISITATSFGQNMPNQTPNQTINGKKQGNWVYWYNAKWEPATIKDSIAFYRNLTFKDDKPIGLVTDFYKSGQKQWEGQLITVEPELNDGTCFWYYENGNKSSVKTFINGLQEGEEINYYENGNRSINGFYQNGDRSGHWIWYKEDGTIKSEEDYQIKSEAEKQWSAKNEQFLKLYNEGNYAEAMIIGEANLNFAKNALGEDHPDYARS